VIIRASAPTRIDLAGATLDIWPLYLHHLEAQTLNVAITIRAHCWIKTAEEGGIRIQSLDTGQTIRLKHESELLNGNELILIRKILHFFKMEDVEVVTRSDSPIGAGIAGSSALNVALCASAARWKEKSYSPEELLQIAMNLEAQAIKVPTGAQDYRPAYYGGVSAIEFGVAGLHRVALDLNFVELERRLILAYTGSSRQSRVNNWTVMKAHLDGDSKVFAHFEQIRDIALSMRQALLSSDWTAVGQLMTAEWEARKQLTPGITTETIEQLIFNAQEAGALGAKICGAGGGGCLVCLAESSAVQNVEKALTNSGAEVLKCAIDTEGLSLTIE
jgi:D-glycero-alpha-D-manno-heptose-7-phosphate kinase